MLLRVLFILISFTLLTLYSSIAQDINNPHFCGFHAGEKDIERLVANLEYAESIEFHRSNEVFYVPLKFHLIARADGTGRVNEIDAMNQICILNQNFAPHNIQFFLKDKSFNYINSTAAYNNPSNSTTTLNNNRDSRALNVYWANETIPGENVLGYYDPQRDWVVVRNNQINSPFTLSHEVGHFFSLMHTFFGWETEPWQLDLHGNPVTQEFAPYPWAQIRVELVDGSNCNISADRICDTPPDYGFGSLWGGCSPFNLEIFDRNNDLVEPMQNNYMSYFFNCPDYEFTPMQEAAMRADFSSPARNYLRNGFGIPETDEITNSPQAIYPEHNGTSDYFDEVSLIWDDVPGASFYFVEVSPIPIFGNNSIVQTLVYDNEFIINDLNPNATYHWRVKAMNETNFCAPISQRFTFQTSDIRTSVSVFPESSISFSLIKNPLSTGMNPSILIKNNQDFQELKFEIYSINGQLLSTESASLSSGNHKLSLNHNFNATGMYFISITSNNYRKVLPVVIN